MSSQRLYFKYSYCSLLFIGKNLIIYFLLQLHLPQRDHHQGVKMERQIQHSLIVALTEDVVNIVAQMVKTTLIAASQYHHQEQQHLQNIFLQFVEMAEVGQTVTLKMVITMTNQHSRSIIKHLFLIFVSCFLNFNSKRTYVNVEAFIILKR